MSIALLRDAAQSVFAAGRMLSRHQADPGSKTAAGRERFPISDLGHQRGSDNRTNARDFLQPSAFFTRAVPRVDTLLEGHDLGPGSRILASKDGEAEPRSRWNAAILLVSDDLEQLCCAIAALRRDNAELGHVPADRIRQHRSLTNQKLPAAMQHQAGLLLFGLGRDKSHRRPRDCFADCGSVVGIVFAALQIGFHVARRQQPHGVAKRLKPAAPIMCARTCLNADEAGWQAREELQQLRSANALADHYRPIGVHAVDLKNRLPDIETDRANLAHGRLPSSGSFRRNHPMALDAAEWAPSTASKAAVRATLASSLLSPPKRKSEASSATSEKCQKPTLTCEQIQNIRGRSCNDRYLAGSQRGRFHRLWTVSRVSEGRANAYRDATAPEAV